MKKIIAFFTLFTVLLTSIAFAESFNGKVISVIDGNNLIVASREKTYKVRLVGIECPEMDQPFGSQAKQYVTDLVRGREVWVDIMGVDHDNRMIGLVKVNGKDISLEVTRAGLAWCDTKFHRFQKIVSAEQDVKSKKIGLWAYSGAKHPSLHRQERRGIVAMMSKSPCVSGGDFATCAKENFGWGIRDASWEGLGTWSGGITAAPGIGGFSGSGPPGVGPPGRNYW